MFALSLCVPGRKGGEGGSGWLMTVSNLKYRKCEIIPKLFDPAFYGAAMRFLVTNTSI
jgi:hypothetical protein